MLLYYCVLLSSQTPVTQAQHRFRFYRLSFSTTPLKKRTERSEWERKYILKKEIRRKEKKQRTSDEEVETVKEKVFKLFSRLKDLDLLLSAQL